MAASLSRVPQGSARVRGYRDADLHACAAIFAAGTATALRRAPPGDPVGAFKEATKGEIVLVAELDSGIAGFVAIFAPEAFVHHLYVAEGCRRRGAGAALLKAALKLLRRQGALKCRLDNTPALAFYQRLGWQEAERGYDPDAGVWVRLLSP